jgi:hypothetical protein
MIKRCTTMLALHQLLKEFWIPLLIAIGWGIYNVLGTENSQWSTREFVNWFAPAFFFASWLLAQWFRVRKQQKIEGDLEHLQTLTKVLLEEVSAKTKHLLDQLTGGDSLTEKARMLETEKGLIIDVDQSARSVLLERGYSPDLGARPLERAVDEWVVQPLVDAWFANRVRVGRVRFTVAAPRSLRRAIFRITSP